MKPTRSQRRKLAYLLGIVVLLGPIVALSYPASGTESQDTGGRGGFLSRMRAREGLGQATLGDVDPTSLTMNLVLLGLRGAAANALWTEALHKQRVHDWSGLRAAVNSIILLQPHFIQVWSFQGWNLSYNVSAEFDAVEDRYYWVKEGTLFLQDGASRNDTVPDLFHQVGWQLANKIGTSDERDVFRKMFLEDKQWNQDGKDNYLAARDWYERAIEVADTYNRAPKQGHPVVFRSKPGLALMQYAAALERDGYFGERARSAWQTAYEYWTGTFGRTLFAAPDDVQVRLEYMPEERDRLTDQQRYWSNRYGEDIVNYQYWKMRADTERSQDLLSARRNVYLGDKAYREGDLRAARKYYEDGMRLWDGVLKAKPQLLDAQETIDEGVNVLLRYRDILTQFGEEDKVQGLEPGKDLPDDFPMKAVWERFEASLREQRLAAEAQAEEDRAREARHELEDQEE